MRLQHNIKTADYFNTILTCLSIYNLCFIQILTKLTNNDLQERVKSQSSSVLVIKTLYCNSAFVGIFLNFNCFPSSFQ